MDVRQFDDLGAADRYVWRLGKGAIRGILEGLAVGIERGRVAHDGCYAVALVARRVREAYPRGSDPARREAEWIRRIQADDLLMRVLAAGAGRCLTRADFAEIANLPRPRLLAPVQHAVEKVSRRRKARAAFVDVAVRYGADRRQLEEALRRQALALELRLVPDEPLTRHMRQTRRRVVAEACGVPQPAGRGRRRGAEGQAVARRRTDLATNLRALGGSERVELLLSPAAPDWVAGHAARFCISRATASRDWQVVKCTLAHETGYLTPYAHAVLAGDRAAISREQRRLRSFERRVFGGRR